MSPYSFLSAICSHQLAAYSDGSIRAYNLNSQQLAFTFSLDYQSTGGKQTTVATVRARIHQEPA
jgi:hypothetical protein